jgi:hypothetical protein
MAEISADWDHYAELRQHMFSSSLGIVEAKEFLEVLRKARHGQRVPTVTVLRTLGMETWLQKLGDSKVLSVTASVEGACPFGKERYSPLKG